MRTRRQKIWEKRISFILVIIITIIILLQGLPKKINLSDTDNKSDYYASSMDTRKIISLVYDDSASMSDQGNVNWAYANYAFQIFIGLLNPNDSLYITYMSKPRQTNLLVDSTTTRQEAIIQARSHFRNSNTPLTAVNSAYDKLNSFEATTDPVEYWLVVITDGYLQSAATGEVLTEEYISETIKGYSNMTLDNGSPINVVYMGIGDEVAIIDEDDEDNKAIVKYAKDGADIITRMSEIAMEIGNWEEEEEGVTATFINETQAEVKITGGPLEKIAALIQGTNIRIKSVKKVVDENQVSGTEEKLFQDLQVQYPVYPGCVTDESLWGSVQFVTGEKGYLDIGTYIITFDDNIQEAYRNQGATINLFYDSALETRLYIYNEEDNIYVKAGNSLSDQILYTVSSKAFVTKTELAYEDYMLEMGNKNNSANYFLSTNNNGNLKSVYTNILDSDQFTKADTVIIESIIDYLGIEDNFRVTVPVVHAPIYATKISGTKGKILRTDLIDRSLSMKMKIYHDDVPYTRKELQNMRLKVESSERYVDVYTLVDTDGTITITPYFGNTSLIYKIFLGWLQSWVIDPGTNQIVLSFNDDSKKEAFVCKEAFVIEQESLPLNVWHHLLPFIAFFLLWGYTYKPKIKRSMQLYAIPLAKDDDAYRGKKEDWVELKKTRLRSILPYLTDTIETEELKIVADKEKDNSIVIRAFDDWVITNIIIREDTISKTLDVLIHDDSERLMKINTLEMTTDENIGLIVENEEKKEYSLFLVRFKPRANRSKG